MVKNNSGGSKTKNIANRNTRKKISAEEPDFENSFFAVVLTKPNGMICSVKLCSHEKLKDLNITQELQVNIGKLKNDKRNCLLNLEISFKLKSILI